MPTTHPGGSVMAPRSARAAGNVVPLVDSARRPAQAPKLRAVRDDEVVTLETFAESLRDAFLACRELGHVWRPFSATYDSTARCYDRRLRCTRCRCERLQVISSTGHVLGNSYRYPDGYQARNIERGVYSRDVFRIESVRRYLDKDGK